MSSFRPRQRTAQTYDLLPPEKARKTFTVERFSRPMEVEDAQFTVIAAPRSAPRPSRAASAPVPPGNDNAGRRPHRSVRTRMKATSERGMVVGERWLGRLSHNMFSALVAAIFLLVFGLAGGFDALASIGRVGDPIPSRVDVTHVTAMQRTVNGLPMLVISGIIENNGSAGLSSPRLRAEIWSGGRLVASTLFRPRTGDIAQGESRGFQAKLPQAGGKAPDVKVFYVE